MDPQEVEKIGLVAVGGMAEKLARILSLESEWELSAAEITARTIR